MAELLAPTMRLLAPMTNLITPTMRLLTPMTNLIAPIMRLLTPMTRLLTPMTRLLTPTTRLLTPMMTPKIGLLCVLLSLGLQGCEAWTKKDFRFRGTYLAEKSGYRLELISKGVREILDGPIEIHRFVQICPIQPSRGKPLRFRIMEPRSSESITIMGEDASIPPTAWDWKSHRRILRDILAQAGFESPNPSELDGTAQILEAQGNVSKGLAAGLTVKQEDWNADYWFGFDRTQPQSTWINSSELPPCS